MPIFAARATGSDEAVKAFLEVQMETRYPQLRGMCTRYFQNEPQKTNYGCSFTFSRRISVPYYAVEHGDEVLLTFFLETGEFDLEFRLCSLARNGNERLVRLFLDKGVNVEAKDSTGRTPLSHAVEGGHLAVMSLLIANGAILESKDNGGRTPLSWAESSLHEDVVILVNLLLGKGANLESKDNDGRTPLSWAVRSSRGSAVTLVKLLLDKGANLESKDNGGRTPLSWAAKSFYMKDPVLLLNKEVTVEAKENNNQTVPEKP